MNENYNIFWCPSCGQEYKFDQDVCNLCGGMIKIEYKWTREKLISRIAELEAEIELLRTPMSKRLSTYRKHYTCPRCGNFGESEISSDGRTTCPACENEVVV